MSAIILNKEYYLGSYQPAVGSYKLLMVSPISLKLQEQIDISFYRVDSFTGKIDKEEKLALSKTDQEIYNVIFQTKPQTTFFSSFMIERTHSFEDACLDFLVPTTRRFTQVMPRNAPNIALTFFVIIWDIITLSIRFITIPIALIKEKEEHSGEPYFPAKTESVFVEYKVTWQIKSQDEKIQIAPFTDIFRWRIDFHPAWQFTFFWDKEYPLYSDSMQRCVLEENENQRNKYIQETLIGNFRADCYANIDSSFSSLSQTLSTICAPPIVTFC